MDSRCAGILATAPSGASNSTPSPALSRTPLPQAGEGLGVRGLDRRGTLATISHFFPSSRRPPQAWRPYRLSHRILLWPRLRSGQSQGGVAPPQTQAASATQRADPHRVTLPPDRALPATAHHR